MAHPHDILGVDRDADAETIKRAFFQRARSAHPDAGGSKEEFIRLRAAYEALQDESAPAEAVEPRHQPEEPVREADWKSYEEIMEEVRSRLDREDEVQPATVRDWQSEATRDVCWAIGLTLLCAGVIATWFSYDGHSWDQSLWSVSFFATLIVVGYVGGLAAVVGSTPMTNDLTIYCRFVTCLLIVLALLLFHAAYTLGISPDEGHSGWPPTLQSAPG